jgi:hypothetical protein
MNRVSAGSLLTHDDDAAVIYEYVSEPLIEESVISQEF